MTTLWRKYRKEARFLLLFIFFFLSLQGLHYLTRADTAPFLVNKMTASVSSRIINLITPGEKTTAVEDRIGSGSHQLRITLGCDGTEGLIIVLAAILAFKMSLAWKLSGLALGVLTVYAFNLVRVVSLYYTYKYSPALFDIMHTYVGQSMIILAGLGFFVLWVRPIRQEHAVQQNLPK